MAPHLAEFLGGEVRELGDAVHRVAAVLHPRVGPPTIHIHISMVTSGWSSCLYS